MSIPLEGASNRRRHRRVPVKASGRLLLETGEEVHCRLLDISPGGIRVSTTAPARKGERVVLYLDEIGRVEGSVARLVPGGFAVALTATLRKREKLAAVLTFIVNREQLGIEDMRELKRSTPLHDASQITLANGSRFPARIVDISSAGVRAVSQAPLSTGMVVQLNGQTCSVLRSQDGEFALLME